MVFVAAIAALAAASPPTVTRRATGRRTSSARHGGQAIIFAERPSVFDRNTLVFDGTVLSQAAAEGSLQARTLDRRSCAEKADHRHRLLRPRSESADRRRPQTSDELSPFHFINLPSSRSEPHLIMGMALHQPTPDPDLSPERRRTGRGPPL
jgi:hypothetical protein